MSTNTPTPFRKAWLRWKTLKLPWRKRFLVGLDLDGNTFWEFRDAATAKRMRRIVEYPRSTHYSDIRISPQWHQWLRHTREHPPSLTEQSQDLVRQRNMKTLAAEADRRWREKPSFLDRPEEKPALGPDGVLEGTNSEVVVEDKQTVVVEAHVGAGNYLHTPVQEKESQTEKENDPWKKARGGPSEEWQPQAWNPQQMPAARR